MATVIFFFFFFFFFIPKINPQNKRKLSLLFWLNSFVLSLPRKKKLNFFGKQLICSDNIFTMLFNEFVSPYDARRMHYRSSGFLGLISLPNLENFLSSGSWLEDLVVDLAVVLLCGDFLGSLLLPVSNSASSSDGGRLS